MHTDSHSAILALRPHAGRAVFMAHTEPTNLELKNLVEEGNRAYKAFQDNIETRLQHVEGQDERLDNLEAHLNRSQLAGGGGERSGDQYNADQIQRFNNLCATSNGRSPGFDATQLRNYKSALISYARRGDQVSPDIKAELSVGSDPNGGYFVEPDTSGRIIRKVFESSPVRQVANIATTQNESLQGILDQDEVGSGWVGEQDTRGETDTPEVGEYEIFAHEQYAMPIATQKLLEDADRNVEAWLIDHISRKFARQEASAFVSGNGIKKPRGFLTHPTSTAGDSTRADSTLQIVKTGASGDFATSDPADSLYDLVFSLKADYQANAVWMMDRLTMNKVAKLKDGDGNYLLSQGRIDQATPFRLLGYPVFLADDMPDVAADSNSIAFGDFSRGYQIVDRLGISLLRDPYTTKGKVKFYSRRRVGGAVVDFDAIKLLQFAS